MSVHLECVIQFTRITMMLPVAAALRVMRVPSWSAVICIIHLTEILYE